MSSDFSDFLGQGFMRAMLPLMCAITLLLIATIAAIVYMRRRKAQQTLAKAMPAPGFVTASDYASSSHDMPDLNLLIQTPTPPPPPTHIAAPVVPLPVGGMPAPVRSARVGLQLIG